MLNSRLIMREYNNIINESSIEDIVAETSKRYQQWFDDNCSEDGIKLIGYNNIDDTWVVTFNSGSKLEQYIGIISLYIGRDDVPQNYEVIQKFIKLQ